MPLFLIGRLLPFEDDNRAAVVASVVASVAGLGAFVLTRALLRAPEFDSILRGVRRIRARGV